MPIKPVAPIPPRSSRKLQAPLNDNGDPVTTTIPASKKRKTAPEKTTNAVNTGPTLKSLPNKKASQTRSVSIEEVPDEDDLRSSNPPHNPKYILEYVSEHEVDSSSSTGDGEVLEEAEEDDDTILEESYSI